MTMRASRTVSYPRRQRNRRLAHAIRMAALAIGALSLATAAALARIDAVAIPLAAVGMGSGLRARRWSELARRSAIGAQSEDRVRGQLRKLEAEGWVIRHALRWRGGGDIDHIATAPGRAGLAFAIETKTRSYHAGDLSRIAAIAASLERHGRFGARHRLAIPILCVAGARGVERREGQVVVVSVERLLPVLRRLAGTTARPGFLR
jgi:Nuclease-related domain